MRLDHIAYRVGNRDKAVEFISKTLNYSVGTEFEIEFDDGSMAQCKALVPPEKMSNVESVESGGQRHTAPEIFVSEGTKGSIVERWVSERGGGGIHHVAYEVSNIDKIVKDWKQLGVAFASDSVIDCPEDRLRQIFTKPLDELGGIIIELIQRGDKGFCTNSVKDLMQSTEEL